MAPSLMGKWVTEPLWGECFLQDQCGGSFPASSSLVWASFPSDRQDHGSQQWAAESSWFCLSPLYHSSTTPSLVLTLSLSVSPPLHCSLPCPAEEQGLIWRVHNNSCNSPALTGPPRARPGPRVQCQTHMCLPVRSEILILQPDCAVPSHDHILVPNPLFYFSPACFPKPNPHIIPLCPHSSRTACPGSEMGHGRREKRREEPCLKLAFTLMIYEHPHTLPVYPPGFGLQCGNTGQQEGSCYGADNEWSMYDVIAAGSSHSVWCTVISAVM